MNDEKRNSVLGFGENFESALCYIGLWVTGLIFFLISKKNKKIRFHAAQSFIFFGIIFIVKTLLSFIPLIGKILTSALNFVEVGCAVIFALIVFNTSNEFNIPVVCRIADELTKTDKLS